MRIITFWVGEHLQQMTAGARQAISMKFASKLSIQIWRDVPSINKQVSRNPEKVWSLCEASLTLLVENEKIDWFRWTKRVEIAIPFHKKKKMNKKPKYINFIHFFYCFFAVFESYFQSRRQGLHLAVSILSPVNIQTLIPAGPNISKVLFTLF